MTDVAIRTEGLTRTFGPVRAVDGLTLEVPVGAIFGFLGPNGAGKTTTIRLLLGLLEPTAGRAQVLGFDTRTQADAIREHAGFLLEHHGLYERLTGEDNLDFWGRIYHLSKAERQARIGELLNHMGLQDRWKENVGTWSRGMKQKLAVARALLHRPRLIFLDEPTAGLDPVAAATLREDIRALAEREGVTVFLTTHNLTEAEKLCSLVGVIRKGVLLTVGHPDSLSAHARVPQVEVSGRGFTEAMLEALRARPEVSAARIEDNRLIVDLQEQADTSPLVSLLVRAGAEVGEVRRTRASLEDVFLTLMEEGE
ncbi:MAG: ABC transporter ATP-binding protein [Anaerolineae bacterium]